MRILSLFLFIVLLSFNLFAIDVNLAWDASPSDDVTGYAIYYGTNSGSYSTRVDAGNLLSVTVSNLTEKTNYFFVATAYTADNLESLPSNEVSYIGTNKYVYLVSKLDYGTSLNALKTTNLNILSFINPPNNQFYRASLIITNKVIPLDTNKYTQLMIKLDYGTNFSSLKTTNIPIFLRQNPPNGEFYRNSLIITNKAF